VSTTTPSRTATLATVGGVLWFLLPAAWAVASPQDTAFGSLAFVSVAVSMWLFAVLPPLLLIGGIAALRSALGPAAGRFGVTALAIAGVGYAAMTLGNGIEVASISAGGGEVAAGHAIFLGGFLVSIVGGILTGVLVFRRRRGGLARAAALLLIGALPVGLAVGLLGSALDPNNDAWVWAAIAAPTGLAWVLVGRALQPADAPVAATVR
jgi:hypothetical protein